MKRSKGGNPGIMFAMLGAGLILSLQKLLRRLFYEGCRCEESEIVRRVAAFDFRH